MHLRSLTLVIRLTYLALMLMLVTACAANVPGSDLPHGVDHALSSLLYRRGCFKFHLSQ